MSEPSGTIAKGTAMADLRGGACRLSQEAQDGSTLGPTGEFRLQVDRVLRSITHARVVFCGNARNARIEGQFGGETIQEGFSGIHVFLQHSVAALRYDLVQAIVRQIYSNCARLNHGGMVTRVYLISGGSTQLIGRNISADYALAAPLEERISGLPAADDARTIARFVRRSDYDESSLFVFVTDAEGCELSEDLKRQHRAHILSRRSVWVRVLEEGLEVSPGLPAWTHA